MAETHAIPLDLDALDSAALKALIRSQQQLLLSSRNEIENLNLLIAKLRRMQFGTRSEKLDRHIEQLELRLEDLESSELQAEEIVPDPALPAVIVEALLPARKQPVRKSLPASLPRETETHMPDHEACPDCGGAFRPLGEDVSETLEYVPASFKVVRHVRPKLSCGGCGRIVQKAAPSRAIDKGLPGPGLLAHMLVAKYADHLPLYRQEAIYARGGVELSRSTLAGWVGAVCRTMAPLGEALRRYVLDAKKLHGDDTPVPVLAPGNGKTRTGRLWTYVRDDRPAGSVAAPAVWFAYSPDRRGEHPRLHLKEFRGTLQADGYAGFNELYESGGIREAACWAHVRRKFFDLYKAHGSASAKEALERIGQLYGIESGIRGGGAGRAADGTRSAGSADAGVDARLDGDDFGASIEEIAPGGCDPLCPGALGGVDAVLRGRRVGDRQQRGGARVADGRDRAEELLVRGIGCGWAAGGGVVWADWQREVEWDRSGGISAACTGADCGSPGETGCRITAVECPTYAND